MKLQIWDTVRQENFQSITRQFYRAAVAAILVFDVTRKETFRHIESWMEQVKQHGTSQVTMLPVGNKSDLERTVTRE